MLLNLPDQLALALGVSVCAVVVLAAWLAATKQRRNVGEARSMKLRIALTVAVRDADAATLERLLSTMLASRRGRDDVIVALDRLRHEGITDDQARLLATIARELESGAVLRLIAAMMASKGPTQRARGALLAGVLGLSEPIARLAALLEDPDVDARQAACRALGMLASDDAAWVLTRALDGGRVNPDRVLEELERPWAAPVLELAIAAPAFAPVRSLLAEALGCAGDASATPALVALLESGSDEERTRACRALARTHSRAGIPALCRALVDTAWQVRAQAALALGAIGRGDQKTVMALEAGLTDPQWWVRANCASALVSIGPKGVAGLERALASDDRFARDRAREALALRAAAEPIDRGTAA